MRGQWLGSYSGGTDGKVMINVDLVEDHFDCVAYVIPSTKELPSSVVYFSTPDRSDEQVAQAYIAPIDPRTGFQGDWESIKVLYGEEVVHSSEAKVLLKILNGRLHINATTNNGATFAAVLDKPTANAKSKIPGQRMSWDTFKASISSRSKFSFLFRGQSEPWSLCTSFHRRGR